MGPRVMKSVMCERPLRVEAISAATSRERMCALALSSAGESRPRATSTGVGDQVVNNAGREIENLKHVPARYLLAHSGVGVGEPEAAREIEGERERESCIRNDSITGLELVKPEDSQTVTRFLKCQYTGIRARGSVRRRERGRERAGERGCLAKTARSPLRRNRLQAS
jgi:hypothetical protein